MKEVINKRLIISILLIVLIFVLFQGEVVGELDIKHIDDGFISTIVIDILKYLMLFLFIGVFSRKLDLKSFLIIIILTIIIQIITSWIFKYNIFDSIENLSLQTKNLKTICVLIIFYFPVICICFGNFIGKLFTNNRVYGSFLVQFIENLIMINFTIIFVSLIGIFTILITENKIHNTFIKFFVCIVYGVFYVISYCFIGVSLKKDRLILISSLIISSCFILLIQWFLPSNLYFYIQILINGLSFNIVWYYILSMLPIALILIGCYVSKVKKFL